MSCHNYKLLKCNYRNNGVDHFGLLASSYKLWKKSWYTMNYYYLDTKSEVFFKKDRTPTSRYQVLGCKKIFVNENRKWILDRKICFVFSSTYTTYLLITCTYVCCKIKNENDWWLIWWSSQEKSETFMLCQGGLLFDCFSKLRISVSFLFKSVEVKHPG